MITITKAEIISWDLGVLVDAMGSTYEERIKTNNLLLQEYHPDTCKDPEANDITAKLNLVRSAIRSLDRVTDLTAVACYASFSRAVEQTFGPKKFVLLELHQEEVFTSLAKRDIF